MRPFTLPIFLVTLYSCDHKHSETYSLTSCDIEKQQGFQDYQKGEFHFINNEPLSHESDLKTCWTKRNKI